MPTRPMRQNFISAALAMASLIGPQAEQALPQEPQTFLFQNVRIFDGTSSELSPPSNVLVRGSTIEEISTDPIPVDRTANTQVIDGGGRTLMPSLIDAHVHLEMWTLPIRVHGFGQPGLSPNTPGSRRERYFDGRLYFCPRHERSDFRQSFYLPKLTRWYTPAEVLKMATHDNAELLALSGPRNPYPRKLGVVEEGALADLLLVDGDPLANIKLLEDPAKNLVVIMKDGKIYKNTVPH